MPLIKKIYRTTGFKFVSSGLILRLAKVFCSFYILTFIDPSRFGEWQNFTVFFPFVMIFTLGVSNTINLELPAHIGANEVSRGIEKLSVAGYFIKVLSCCIFLVLFITGLFLFFSNALNSTNLLYWLISIVIVIGSINNNFLRSTFRSSDSFLTLGKIQYCLAFYAILVVPLGLYLGVFGIALHLLMATVFEFFAMYANRPYKVNYKWNKLIFTKLVSTGTVLYIWNNLNILFRSLPRVTIVIVGDVLTLGLYSPINNLSTLMANIGELINTYTFPKMSYLFGRHKESAVVIKRLKSIIIINFLFLFVVSALLFFLVPYLVVKFLPNFKESAEGVKFIVFLGPIIYINLTMHKFIISIKRFSCFKILIPMRFIMYIITFICITNLYASNLMSQVACSALVSELIGASLYIIFIKLILKRDASLAVTRKF